jgi:hypothetical protein
MSLGERLWESNTPQFSIKTNFVHHDGLSG